MPRLLVWHGSGARRIQHAPLSRRGTSNSNTYPARDRADAGTIFGVT
jgi:hypothetical protein